MRAEFDLAGDRVWLSASHQGPLPTKAAEAVAEMVRWKQQPHHLAAADPFGVIPGRLRHRLADLLSAPESELVLANSSSYGIHLVANGLQLEAGDEVVVAANDFPSDILPWLRLRDRGVVVRQVRPDAAVATPDEIAAALTENTRVVCLTWVHSFSGQVIDLDGIGQLCRDAGVLFVVNGSQGVGALPLDLSDAPIDALSGVGFKWLCGPYGTGFCWLNGAMLDRVESTKFYWLSALTSEDLAAEELDLDSLSPPESAARHDVFGTANFFNFAALAESVGLVSSVGVDDIHRHNLGLTERLVDGLDSKSYRVAPRGDPARLSSIVLIEPLRRGFDETSRELTNAGVDLSRRRGMLRAAPHFYNTNDDIDRALAVMHDVANGSGSGS